MIWVRVGVRTSVDTYILTRYISWGYSYLSVRPSVRRVSWMTKRSSLCIKFLIIYWVSVWNWCSTRWLLVFVHLSDQSYDCTFKESLYSTHPYLTYSNERIATPMMRRQSIHGFREENSISGHHCLEYCGEEQHQELFQSWSPCMHFE